MPTAPLCGRFPAPTAAGSQQQTGHHKAQDHCHRTRMHLEYGVPLIKISVTPVVGDDLMNLHSPTGADESAAEHGQAWLDYW